MLDFLEKRPSEIPIVVIDTETTGLIPEMGHRVVEIGALRLEDGRETGQLSTLLNPGRKIDADASRVNGIHSMELHGQPTFADVAEAFLTLSEGALLVAHNAAFDAGFVGMELFINHFHGRATPPTLAAPWLCTLELARRYFHFGANNLGAIAQQLGVRTGRAHRALTDVYTTAEILKRMLHDLEKQHIETVGDLLHAQGGAIYTPTQPPFVLPELIEDALRHGRDLSIRYQSQSGLSSRIITPRYPTSYQGHTYLVSYCHTSREQRTFRLDRIMAVQVRGN